MFCTGFLNTQSVTAEISNVIFSRVSFKMILEAELFYLVYFWF